MQTGVRQLLRAMAAFKAIDSGVNVPQIIAFLCLAEHEGVGVQEICELSGLSQSATSRALRSLGPAGSTWSKGPALGLVDAFLHPHDNRRHVLRLSERGMRLRERLEYGEPERRSSVLAANMVGRQSRMT